MKDYFRNNSAQMHTLTLAFLEKYGDEPITSISIFRQPILHEVGAVANILTIGNFVKKLKRAGHTQLYHTGLLINGRYMMEKWLNVGFRMSPDISQREYYPVSMAGVSITLRQFYMNGIHAYGDAIWKYDICNNNCQKAVLQLLDANHLATELIKKFMFQDMSDVLSPLERLHINNMFRLQFHLAKKHSMFRLLSAN